MPATPFGVGKTCGNRRVNVFPRLPQLVKFWSWGRKQVEDADAAVVKQAKRKQHAPRKLPPLQACVWFRDLVEEGVEPQPGPRVKNKLRNWYALVTLNIGGRSSMWNFLSHARDTGAEILCIQEHKREIDEMQKLLVQVGAATTHWVAVAAAWGLMPELAEL